ncbi:transcription elongation factor Elf1 [Streptomyces sp. LBL]|uniref:hypothetical protein n=1 Tax=Streptomyces sp. LBL TaxID=2940562 RepID=UPI002474293C|nr:hypothetical protein [Streptomyces sp. LBL]MDH6629413.1 transcription elongation factor Elf1 [Streptomyces sp. LBL]
MAEDLPTPASRPNPRPDLDFTPVRNGMDYLAKAVDDLTAGTTTPSERDLKYAVLHLQAATEVLLKARLVGEHWSLVFKNPGGASLEDFKKGKFESCTIDATMDRLESIAQVKISPTDRTAIKVLADDRNALTHYGHTANAFQVEARAARVLDFLLNFITEHLRPMLNAEFHKRMHTSKPVDFLAPSMVAVEQGPHSRELRSARGELRQVDRTMDELRMKLGRIRKLVEKRMQAISGDLASTAYHTVRCPDCRQWALVVNDDMSWNPITCRFCLASYNLDMAALQYVWRVTGENNGTVQHCPACGATDTLVIGASTAAQKTANLAICFNCAHTHEAKIDGQH